MVETIWLKAQHRLRAELAEKDYETWGLPLRAAHWADGELTVEAPSNFYREWLRRHFLTSLENAVSEAAGCRASVSVVVNRALDMTSRLPARAAQSKSDESAAPTPINARYTFDNFVVGASNQVAHGAARAVVEQPGARFNPLFLYGGVGLGKTHLLSAIAHGLATHGRGAVMCLSAENFVNEMIGALRRDRMERFRQRFRRIATLVVDDVQFLAGKVRSQEEFYHTFNALHDGRKQIVLASDRPPHELPGIEETLRNRFAAGLMADVQPPDPALRLALVRRKAAELALVLLPEVITHMADLWCENVRQLEGALTRVDAFANLAGRPITLDLVEEALAAYATPRSSRPTLERIVDEVCRHFRLSRTELASARRTARVNVPRQVAMYLCRHHTDAPLGAIGAQLGGRDHSTVVQALAAIERRLQVDAELRESVTRLRGRLLA